MPAVDASALAAVTQTAPASQSAMQSATTNATPAAGLSGDGLSTGNNGNGLINDATYSDAVPKAPLSLTFDGSDDGNGALAMAGTTKSGSYSSSKQAPPVTDYDLVDANDTFGDGFQIAATHGPKDAKLVQVGSSMIGMLGDGSAVSIDTAGSTTKLKAGETMHLTTAKGEEATARLGKDGKLVIKENQTPRSKQSAEIEATLTVNKDHHVTADVHGKNVNIGGTLGSATEVQPNGVGVGSAFGLGAQ